MRKIINGLAWLTYRYPVLSLTMQMVSLIFVAVGATGLVLWLSPEGATISVETVPIRVAIASPFILVSVFLVISFFHSTRWQKIPEIAKDKAQKILKENPQLNPPLGNHVELVKWIESYESLSCAEKDLATTTERLNKLPEEKKELEANKEKVEKEIKNLKSELGIS